MDQRSFDKMHEAMVTKVYEAICAAAPETQTPKSINLALRLAKQTVDQFMTHGFERNVLTGQYTIR